MRMHQSLSAFAGFVALALAWGWTHPVLSAQPVGTRNDSVTQSQHGLRLGTQGTDVVSEIKAGARGLAYLFRPGQATNRNLWQRREHPELWRSTRKEREAARAALPLIGGVAVLALLAWGALLGYRAIRAAAWRKGRERPDRRTPVAIASR